MSIPTFYSKMQLEQPLSLNGNSIAMVNSLCIKSVSRPLQQLCSRDSSITGFDTLPSITTTSRASSAHSLQFRNISLKNFNHNDYQNPMLVNAGNNLCHLVHTKLGSRIEPLSSHLSKKSNNSENDPETCYDVREFSDVEETHTEINNCQSAKASELRGDSPTKDSAKKRRRRKKRLKSKTKFKAHHRKDSRVENIYNDVSLVQDSHTHVLQLQAFSTPIHTSAKTQKTKPSLDYQQHVSTKAPCVPKILKVDAPEKINIAARTKEYISGINKHDIDLPQYMKDNRESIKRYHDQQNSLYGAKLVGTRASTISVSASSECFSFRPPPSKQLIQAQLRKSVNSAPGSEGVARVFKIYQSDKQSSNITELGMEYPCPPPGTPDQDLMVNVEYVPSMSDIRSQRALKIRLESLQKIEKQKKERIKEEKIRLEKAHQKEKVKELRRQQRREIYALNKKMTEFELTNFREFCSNNNIKCDE